jgi:hypothetical protein
MLPIKRGNGANGTPVFVCFIFNMKNKEDVSNLLFSPLF